MNWTTVSTGTVQASEVDCVVRPKYQRTTKRGILYCHGVEASAGATAWQAFQRAKLFNAIVRAGHTLLSCDLGGNGTWGNATAVTRVETAKTYLLGLSGVSATKIVVIGGSMGGFVGLNWIAQNLSECSCFVGLISGFDLTDTHTNNRGSFAAAINTAYGGTYSEGAHGATYNPQTRAAAAAFGSLPMQLWCATSDAIFPPAQGTAFAASVGASCTVNSITGTHSEAVLDEIDPDEVISFIDASG